MLGYSSYVYIVIRDETYEKNNPKNNFVDYQPLRKNFKNK